MKKYLLIFLVFPFVMWSQIEVQTNFGLELAEKDSAKTALLTTSINTFLDQALEGNYSHEYVDSIHRKRYDFFFRKLSKIGNNSEGVKFNKPSVLKSFTPDGTEYRITIAYTGVKDNEPFVFQITELKLLPYKDHYRFYCPFQDYAADFKTTTFEKVNFHYSNSIDEVKAQEFARFKSFICKEAGIKEAPLDYYSFESLNDLLKTYGFLYSARQCNFLCYDLGFTENEGSVYVTGMDDENYIAGFIGEFLYYKLPNEGEMYWPFAEGLSTYYGGYSSKNLEELKQEYRDELKINPEISFLEAFKKGRKASINRHFCHYVMSAFLYEKVLKEKGFDEAMKIVYSGSDGERFFENLNTTIGVNEGNFNETIRSIILVGS